MKNIVELATISAVRPQDLTSAERDCLDSFDRQLAYNGTWCPEPVRVIYSLKTAKSKAKRDANGHLVLDLETGKPVREQEAVAPVLTTTVYFEDGTKSVVQNSEHDALKLDANGEVSYESKEIGLVYAVMKRMIGQPDVTGLMQGNGLARKLKDVVDGAWDVQKEEKKAAAKKKQLQAEALDRAANSKPKTPRFSLNDTLARFNKLMDEYEATKAK